MEDHPSLELYLVLIGHAADSAILMSMAALSSAANTRKRRDVLYVWHYATNT